MDKKGFTLIELLAVIIILAILMIIAVPNILSTLATARSEAFLSQAKSIYKSAEQQYVLDSMTGLANTCYDKNNLDMGSISDTVSFVVSLDEEDGTVNNIEIIDNGQQFKASGKEINNITMKTYTEGTVSCSGYSTPYTESLLNGTDPVLGTGMIPVKLASTGLGWTVTRADTTKRWYKYGKSEWANAVILKSNVTTTYNAGDIIPNANIEAYFVWIPKYKYKLFNMGNYTTIDGTTTNANHSIDIVFGTENTTDAEDSCATPLNPGASGNCAVNKFMTHPSFITLNKNGYWAGKFETTGNASNGTINNITVLPGTSPIVNVTNYEIFTKAYNYNRNLDSHMMKNTEWGAVAYLAHSSYGMGNKNIYINNYNNSGYKTGCVGAGSDTGETTTCTNQWYSTTGYNGSTTGNITGIYDMSGGVWERMAAYRSGTMGSSGFSTTSTDANYIGAYNAKYFDVYPADSTLTSWDKRILGDATGELGPFISSSKYTSSWYGDYAYFVDASYPWFSRGGSADNGSGAGLMHFSRSSGTANAAYGFCLVLAP